MEAWRSTRYDITIAQNIEQRCDSLFFAKGKAPVSLVSERDVMRIRHLYLFVAVVALALTSVTALADDDQAPGLHGGDDDHIQLVLVEHATHTTNLDQGEQGPSIGDAILWGPNPMYDGANTTDTGATTQGVCTAFEPGGDCMVLETILFPDGSMLQLQGVQPGQPETSTRTIVGGSGQYLGAMGTVTVEPTADRAVWTKTFDIRFED